MTIFPKGYQKEKERAIIATKTTRTYNDLANLEDIIFGGPSTTIVSKPSIFLYIFSSIKPCFN